MQGNVQVLECVDPGEVPGLLHHAIDKPGAGWSGDDWTLDVRGSAVGEGSPVESIEFHVHGHVIHIAACDVARPVLAGGRPDLPGAGTSGFYATLSALDLPREFELHLRAVRGDGVRLAFGTLRGRRSALETSFEPSLQPLIVPAPDAAARRSSCRCWPGIRASSPGRRSTRSRGC